MLLDPAPSVAKVKRMDPDDMAVLVGDLIPVLEKAVEPLSRGKYPANSAKLAQALRKVADDFDA